MRLATLWIASVLALSSCGHSLKAQAPASAAAQRLLALQGQSAFQQQQTAVQYAARELQSVLKQALLKASGSVLLPAFLPDLAEGAQKAQTATLATPDLDLASFIRQRLGADATDLYAQTHQQADRVLLPLVLEYTGGNQHQAARLLGIARQTLRQKLRDLGLHVTHAVEAEEGDSP